MKNDKASFLLDGPQKFWIIMASISIYIHYVLIIDFHTFISLTFFVLLAGILSASRVEVFYSRKLSFIAPYLDSLIYSITCVIVGIFIDADRISLLFK